MPKLRSRGQIHCPVQTLIPVNPFAHALQDWGTKWSPLYFCPSSLYLHTHTYLHTHCDIGVSFPRTLPWEHQIILLSTAQGFLWSELQFQEKVRGNCPNSWGRHLNGTIIVIGVNVQERTVFYWDPRNPHMQLLSWCTLPSIARAQTVQNRKQTKKDGGWLPACTLHKPLDPGKVWISSWIFGGRHLASKWGLGTPHWWWDGVTLSGKEPWAHLESRFQSQIF